MKAVLAFTGGRDGGDMQESQERSGWCPWNKLVTASTKRLSGNKAFIR